jgi:F-type H+-transporting ATPase subunit b
MGALGITIPGVVTQLASFLVLFGILYILLYKPILRMLDQRSAKIREGLESAERAREEAAASREDMQRQLDEARTEGQAMIAQAREVADRFREEELAKARTEIAAERARAEADIKRERDSAVQELRQEFAGLAISAAERVAKRSLDESAHKDLIDEFLESAPSSGNGRG